MGGETFMRWIHIGSACAWTVMLGFSLFVLAEISFISGEAGDTSTPLYTAAFFGELALAFQAGSAWQKALKRG